MVNTAIAWIYARMSTILRGVNVEVKSVRLFIHTRRYAALFLHRLVLVFSTLSAFLSTFFYFEANSKKRAHFCRLPTHIHTLMPILTLTLESERRSHLSHTALSCELVCLEKFVVKTLMAHAYTHDYVDSDVHYSHAQPSLHAWHVCSVRLYKRGERIKIKYTGSC